MEADVSRSLFFHSVFVPRPLFAPWENYSGFLSFFLMLSIAKEGLQRFLPSLKESAGANTEATMNMYYCKY